ncbi:MAG: maleylacetate reductase [Sporichthyaceae bacterium]
MRPFVHDQLPSRIVFGTGSLARLAEEVDRLGLRRVLLICETRAKAVGDEAARALGPRVCARIDEVRQHVPRSDVDAALEIADAQGVGGLLAIGGGSAVGLAKALALSLDVRIVAVPTTYAGSEVTPIYGITDGERKVTGRDPRVLPSAVLYDPVLTVGLRPPVTAASGMNALAHCVEALYGPEHDPIVALLAEEGIRALGRGIPASVTDPRNLTARSDALYGAYLAGAVLGVGQMALHHRLSHVLGGTFELPHAAVHSAVLPQVARFNAAAAPEAMARVAAALGVPDAPSGLFDFAVSVGAPTDLASLGMSESRLAEAAALAVHDTTWNPAPVDESAVLAVLRDAYAGTRPT